MIAVKIILGSTREGRKGEMVAKWVTSVAQERKDMHIELLDLRDFPMPFYDEALPSSMLKGEYKDPVVKKWVQKIEEADAYIVVTPEYNHGYPAVLKNALDYPYREWNHKPVAFVSYGGAAGGARSVQQLRQVVIELQMAPVRDGVHLMMMQQPFDEQGNLQITHYKFGLEKVLDSLSWWGKALKPAREK